MFSFRKKEVKPRFRPRDLVAYEKLKHSTSPGPRARMVRPAEHGETYQYCVCKYWVVMDNVGAERLRVLTPSGKMLEVECADPALRPVGAWEFWRLRLFDRDRLAALESAWRSVEGRSSRSSQAS